MRIAKGSKFETLLLTFNETAPVYSVWQCLLPFNTNSVWIRRASLKCFNVITGDPMLQCQVILVNSGVQAFNTISFRSVSPPGTATVFPNKAISANGFCDWVGAVQVSNPSAPLSMSFSLDNAIAIPGDSYRFLLTFLFEVAEPSAVV